MQVIYSVCMDFALLIFTHILTQLVTKGFFTSTVGEN